MLVGAGAEEAERCPVLRGALTHEAPDLHLIELLRHSGERAHPERGRDLREQILDAARADRLEHRRDVGVGVGNEGHQPPSAASTF